MSTAKSSVDLQGAVAPLDESLYKLEGADLDFYRCATGVEDEEQLKQHILAVQKRAFDVSKDTVQKSKELISYIFLKVYKYPCIRVFDFLRFDTSTPDMCPS